MFGMSNYILVIVFAIIMGLLINYFFVLVYVDKLQVYFAKNQNRSNFFKFFGFLFRLSIPISFGAIGFLFPFKIIRYFSKGELAKNLLSIYIYVFVFIFIAVLLLHIKQGKIKCAKGK